MHGSEMLRIEKFRIQRHIGLHVGILFRSYDLSVNQKDDFGRDPAAAELLIFVELGFLSLRSIAAGGSEHTHKVKILLIDPELRRMQVAGLCPDDVNGP